MLNSITDQTMYLQSHQQIHATVLCSDNSGGAGSGLMPGLTKKYNYMLKTPKIHRKAKIKELFALGLNRLTFLLFSQNKIEVFRS